MGEAVQLSRQTPTTRAVRRRLDRSLAALEGMLADGWFDAHADTCGFEVEFDLVDPLGRPRQVNEPVLAAMRRPDLQPELARFNIELNVEPRPIRGDVLRRLDHELSAAIDSLSTVAQQWGARLVTIGTLPTAQAADLTATQLSANPRYRILDNVMSAVRRHPVRLDISGHDRLQVECESIGIQAAATSLQVHIRVVPEDFARYYNAAQAVSPVTVAAAANSPYLLGRRLWWETRIPLLEQSLGVSGPGSRAPDEPPRVWMGERWAATVLDVLADNVRRYEPLLPTLDDQDPLEALRNGRVPTLHELRLHNGSIWRWNRPVYDVQHGHPHLRIENRVMPSGPTAVDMVANAALYLGLVRSVADSDPPVAQSLDFCLVGEDLQAAARLGLDAQLHWVGPSGPQVHVAWRLMLDTVVPLAAEGLAAWGVDTADAERYLGVVENRVRTRRTGAHWQVATVDSLEREGVDSQTALREMVRRYAEHARSGAPVHVWS